VSSRHRRRGGCLLVVLSCLLVTSPTLAEDAPTRWEQLFFPFPIVGAPPQLEQQVQVVSSYFRGRQGSGDGLAAELAAIATPHLGFVVAVPYQIGIGQQPDGLQDVQLLAQYLAAGSLRYDNLLSVGVMGSFPTAQHGLGSGDYLVGPFVYGAQRLWRRLILEGNVTALLPVVHGESRRQILGTALVSVLVVPVRLEVPVYLQAELCSTTSLGGASGSTPGATLSPAETVSIAPEIFIGPFKSPVNNGTRIAAGVFFNLHGDPVHERTYAVTLAFDIPNRFGY
jgi:hypothetical protein